MSSVANETDAPGNWADELNQREAYPVIATVLGAGILALTAAAIYFLTRLDASLNPPLSYGVAAIAASVIWGIIWLVTLRRAGIGWMAAAAATLLTTGAVAVLAMSSAATDNARLDVATLEKIRIDSGGVPRVPRDVYAGPLTARAVAYAHEILRERQKRDATIGKILGPGSLGYASSLTDTPQALTDCGRFARAKGEIDASDGRVADAAARFRRTLESSIGDPALRRDTLAKFDAGYATSSGEIREMSTLRKSQLDQTVGMCELLARKHWRAMGPFFEFSSGSDSAEFNRRAKDLNDNSRQQRDLRGRSIERIARKLQIAGDTRF